MKKRSQFIKDCKRQQKKRKNTPSRPIIYKRPEPSTLTDPLGNEPADVSTSMVDVMNYKALNYYYGNR